MPSTSAGDQWNSSSNSAGRPGRHDPAAVGVAEQHVVVLRQEPHRRRHVRPGPGRVRQVEQLPPVLGPVRTQLGPEPVDHLGQPGQPGPVLHVGDRGRAERGQVTQDQPVRRRIGGERTVEPVRGQPVQRPPAAAPDPARRQLHHRHQRPGGLGQRDLRPLRPALVQQPAQLAEGPRLLGDQRARRRGQLGRVDAVQPGAEARPGHPLQRRLQHRPQRRAVGRADQVDGRALQRDPDRVPARHRRGQLGRVEAGDPGPERHVRVGAAPAPAARPGARRPSSAGRSTRSRRN